MASESINEIKNQEELIKIANKLYDTELKRHNDAGHPLNVLLFLVENGVQNKKGLSNINKNIINSFSQNGFTIIMNIPVAYGGTGKKIHTWILCDLPLLTYISIKLNGEKIFPVHNKVINHINSLMGPNGWRCQNCGNIGKFRGPGKKEDECPLATLNVLKLLSLTKPSEYIDQKERGIDTLLNLWKDRKKRRPYLFGMGTDFTKIKYPLMWYDILNVVNTLSYFPSAMKRKEFKEMYKIISEKVKTNGCIPESVYQYWKDYDFGQKKIESEYIRQTVQEMMKRIEK